MFNNPCVGFKMSNIIQRHEDAITLSRLTIERCQSYIAHIHVLLHANHESQIFNETRTAQGILQLLQKAQDELAYTKSTLGHFD